MLTQSKRSLNFKLWLLLPFYFAASHAYSSVFTPQEKGSWGVALGVRTAEITYKTEDDSVSDVMPLMFYQGEYFYLDGMTTGIHLWQSEKFAVDVIGRFRFVDFPQEFQNEFQEFGMDAGAKLSYEWQENWITDFEVLSDSDNRWHSNLRTQYLLSFSGLEVSPYANLRYKTAKFNDWYFGIDRDDIGSGYEIKFGADGRYPIYKNLFLVGNLALTRYDSDTYKSDYIRSPTQVEGYLGIAFFNTPNQTRRPNLDTKPYVRLAHGWATESSIAEIFAFDTIDDPDNNQMT